MATQNNFCAVNLAFLLVFVLIVPVDASPDRTKTVEFNVKPGGVVHTFTEAIVSEIIKYCLYFTQLANVFKHHPDTELQLGYANSKRASLNVGEFTVKVNYIYSYIDC